MVSSTLGTAAAYATLTCFVLYLLTDALDLSFASSWQSLASSNIPDFSHYKHLETLSSEQFPFHDPNRRVIIVGDIHGVNKSFHRLLDTVRYNPPSDVLVHVGDIMAKSPRSHSLAVLSYMSNNNITGVRGNHDQAVIEWRGWVNWINSLPGGQQWLQSEHQSWHKARSKGIKLKVWQEQQRNTGDKKWWRKIPKGWKLFGDHYMIAEGMKKEDYEYLLRLPLKLHVPDAHLFLAHAGLLASDPRFSPSSKRQPLAKLPVIPPTFRRVVADLEGHEERKRFDNNTEVMRHLQEAAVLRDVPQNNDPWVTLNMRSVFKGRITRTKKGKRWSKLWNRDMSHCDGFDQVRHDKNALPCYPSTVIYGHAAAWGLDVKRWSFGLDSGCVYKRELTAMILNGRDPLSSEWDMAALGDFDEYDYEDDVEDQFFDDEWDLEEEDDDADEIMDDDSEDDGSNDAKKKQQTRIVPFGDNTRARVVSISCR